MDALIVVGQISRKDWLVVGDPIAQVPNGLKISIGLRPALGMNGQRRPGKERPEVRVPKSAILAAVKMFSQKANFSSAMILPVVGPRARRPEGHRPDCSEICSSGAAGCE
jgi:hypothetical protein